MPEEGNFQHKAAKGPPSWIVSQRHDTIVIEASGWQFWWLTRPIHDPTGRQFWWHNRPVNDATERQFLTQSFHWTAIFLVWIVLRRTQGQKVGLKMIKKSWHWLRVLLVANLFLGGSVLVLETVNRWDRPPLRNAKKKAGVQDGVTCNT